MSTYIGDVEGGEACACGAVRHGKASTRVRRDAYADVERAFGGRRYMVSRPMGIVEREEHAKEKIATRATVNPFADVRKVVSTCMGDARELRRAPAALWATGKHRQGSRQCCAGTMPMQTSRGRLADVDISC